MVICVNDKPACAEGRGQSLGFRVLAAGSPIAAAGVAARRQHAAPATRCVRGRRQRVLSPETSARLLLPLHLRLGLRTQECGESD